MIQRIFNPITKYSCASYKCGWVVHWNIDFLPEWKTTCLPADEMRIFEQTREHKTTQVVPQVSFEIHESFPRNVFSVWSKFQRGLTRQQRGIDQQSEVSWLFERPESFIDYLRFERTNQLCTKRRFEQLDHLEAQLWNNF